MKQYITEEQLKELSAKQLDRLEEWTNREIITKKPVPKDFRWNVSTLDMSIGQMIEFLDEHTDLSEIRDWVKTGAKEITWCENEELCDALWEAVKEVLK